MAVKNHPLYHCWFRHRHESCERWAASFADFLADVGSRPHPKSKLKRISLTGKFEPGNVRWTSGTWVGGTVGRGHPSWSRWLGIRYRCTTPKATNYHLYGGRGIRMCDRWYNSFDAFVTDVGEPPFEGAVLDRIDVNGHYEPSNVRWTTQSQNLMNRRPKKAS